MRLVRDLLQATAMVRQAGIKSWSRVSAAFLDSVAASYPDLVEANIRNTGPATMDILGHGVTRESGMSDAQFPVLPVDGLDEPVFRALYEVGAIRLDPAGNPVVEPGPAVLLRGLARLALPPKYLRGVVNAARKWRGHEILSESEFRALDAEILAAVRNGLRRCLGETWFQELNHASYLAGRACVLPCMPLRGSQEFYEEGRRFYSGQGAGATVYVYSTTSGLVIPREFRGDASKNHYRYVYFTKGILGRAAADRVYQWERHRTAKELAEGCEQAAGPSAKAEYRREAIETLSRFSARRNLAILEADHFSAWKEWNTLVGPRRHQVSMRSEDLKGKIGHGVIYDLDAFKARADLARDAAVFMDAAAIAGLIKAGGPAVAVAAASCVLLSRGAERLPSLVRQPLLHKCAQDQHKARVIKGLKQTLSPDQVESVVDDLLAHGARIVALKGERAT